VLGLSALGAASVALLAAVTTAGCVVHADAVHTGSLTVQWSIAGTFSPTACSDFAVAEVEVVAFDAGGAIAEQLNVACEGHDAQLELLPGTYTVDVTMLDARGGARSTTLHLPPTYVYADTNVTLDTDFPSSSFY
jgi:hypothetical protein